jgi:polysaccharide deacetylase family protein (PEP-CTERM system associated)
VGPRAPQCSPTGESLERATHTPDRATDSPDDESPCALSVDVEDYFQVQAFAGIVPRSTWDRYPSRVERNTRRLLDVFDQAGATATFFVLGWIGRMYPDLVREIASRGHEIASHGMFHTMLTEQTPDTFRSDAGDSRSLLEDLAGTRVIGFRAPSYSLNRDTLWAIDVLAEEGYEYDSSVFPIRGRRYGFPGGPERPARLRGSRHELAEFPLPTLRVGALRLPVLAGAYLRLLPSWVSLYAARRLMAGRTPFVVNVHPWEIDPDQPTVGSSRRRPWTHYARLSCTEPILARVLHSGRFLDVATRLAQLGLLARGGARGGSPS